MGRNSEQVDVVVIGAGFGGMYTLVKLRERGLTSRVFEAASDVGGTWYWNRYPGARCDVPSIEYSYGFSQELEQEWDWTEVMAGQPEILAYARHVADRFDLRRGIQFDTRVESAIYQDDRKRWRVRTDRGDVVDARFCIMATGCLSVPNTPAIEGADSFAGAVYHTGRWPHEGVDFRGVRVGIIGTGSSGVQSIPVIAETAQHLTVFQRTPNYTMPAHNEPLTDEGRQAAKDDYPELRRLMRESFGGLGASGYAFGGGPELATPTASILETTPEQRKAALDDEGFMAIWRYADIDSDTLANELACDMYREQVSRIVEDPKTAEGLMPRGYPMGCKRPVIDTNYYEAFNRDNVTLVDLRQGGIESVMPGGVRTEQGDFEFDALIWATGFDAMTGALLRIDIRGRDGVTLADRWQAGPTNYLGLQVHGFPNLFTLVGPGSPSVLSNMIMSIEQHVDFISDCLVHMDESGFETVEPDPKAQASWVEHVNEVANGTMLTAPSCNSWYIGANIPGKPRIFMPYVGGADQYRKKCNEIASAGYKGFLLK